MRVGQNKKQEEPPSVIQLGDMDICEAYLGNIYHLL